MPEWLANPFRNASLLWWLPLALLPLVIHLLNRLRRKSVEWGAMRFLLASHATRNRRILLEEVALLAVRTLALAALVLAAARPFVSNPYFGGEGRTRQDVVVVLDASGSMALRQGNMTQFQRATAAAADVIDALGDGDTVSVILAGPTPTPLSLRPEFASDETRATLKRRLTDSSPSPGGLDMIRSLDAALGTLSAGRHAHKQLIVITDGQAEGWHAQEARRWRFLSQVIDDMPVRPEVRVLTVGSAPGRITNMQVAAIRPDRAVIGTDRPVSIHVTVTNTGTETATERSLELFVDDAKISDQDVGPLAPKASGTLEFSHLFSRPGSHLVHARLTGEDQIELDDGIHLAVRVHEALDVLLVDGEPSALPLGSETSYLAAALDPSEVEGEPKIDYLAEAKRVELAETEDVDPSAYKVVVLANVAHLGSRFRRRLEQFVQGGGGLLIAPGKTIDVDWYNAKLHADGKGLLPCRIGPATGDAVQRENGQTVVSAGANHPAVRLSADSDETDIGKVQVYRYFELDVSKDATSRVVLRLADGKPFLIEKPVGRGHVLLLAAPLDTDWTNLPGTKVYVVLAHEMIYWLCMPTLSTWNVDPGQAVAVRFPTKDTPTAARITDPTGKTTEVEGLLDGAGTVYRYDHTDLPGVYRLTLPVGKTGTHYYFTSRGTAAESSLEPMDDRVRESLTDRIGAEFTRDSETLRRQLRIDTSGTEIWQILVAAVLMLLMAEVFLTRRIATVRHGTYVRGVAFGQA